MKKIIELPVYGIKVKLAKSVYGIGTFDNGSIESFLKEECPFCNSIDCDGKCPDLLEHICDREWEAQKIKQEEVDNRVNYNSTMNVIESFILSCACAGVDIESNAFLEAIETTVDACSMKV